MASFFQDLRYGLRTFAQHPAFTVVVIATLAIGIGSNCAIFSVANAVLFRSLPYHDPGRLVLIWNRNTSANAGRALVSGPDFLDYESQTSLFEGFAGAFAINGTITGEGRPEQLLMGWSTQNLFKILGVSPVLGRDFAAEDAVPIDPQALLDPDSEIPPGVLLLSYGLWQRRFGGDPSVLGKSLELDGQRSTIVGVLPRDFRIYLPADAGMPTNVEIWRVLPIAVDTHQRNVPWLTVVARLREGAGLEQAQSELDALAARLREQYAFHANAGMQIELNSMHQDVVNHVRPILYALLGAGTFVLLISWANVANLMLARAASREREIAVRVALGSGQWRLIRQLLVESGLLSFGGGLSGLALAWAGIRALTLLQPENIPRLEQIRLDGTVMGFCLALVLLSAMGFGLIPALKAARPDLVAAFKERGAALGGIRGNRIRTGLVLAEVSLSAVLLIGAGLLTRSFLTLLRVDPGFDAGKVLTFSAPLPMFKYRAPARRLDFYLELNRRLRTLPGVLSAGSVTPLPLAGGDQFFVTSYGRLGVTEEQWNSNKADARWVTPGYFRAMGISLRSGRLLDEADNHENARAVVLVDEKLAEKTWPGEDPVDKVLHVERFNLDNFEMERSTAQVAGIVEHIRSQSLAEEGREAIYFPLGSFPYAPQSIALGGRTELLGLAAAIQSEIQTMDPDVPVADLRTMQDYIDEASAPTRFTLILISTFAALALMLASIGLYGVLSYSVTQRTQEIGVRMAFGARSNNILRLIMGQGMVLVGLGILLGILLSLPAARLVSSQLVGITATDPLTYLAIAVILMGVAAIACYLPSRRAIRVDPVAALTGERALSRQ